MTTVLKTILVTGANRGLGLAICQSLLAHPTTTTHPIKLYAASRAGAPLGLSPQPGSEIHCAALDISSPSSINALAETLASQDRGLNVLINNAGINLDDQYTLPNARRTLEVNYHGTLQMCQTFLPLLTSTTPSTPSGEANRIVNLSSIASKLHPYAPSIQSRFRLASSLTDIHALLSDYLHAVSLSSEEDHGFGPARRSYNISKAALNSATRILAEENPGVMINACCPGWVWTEMGRMIGRAPKTGEEGARIPVRLAVGDVGGLSGRVWANDSVRGRGEGRVQDW